MSPNRNTRIKQSPKRGVTLTEVIVGIVLLGSLLTMMLVAAGRLERQRRSAELKLAAVAELDKLTSRFFAVGFPALPSTGLIPENAKFAWEAVQASSESPETCLVARIRIVDREKPNAVPYAVAEVLVDKASLGRQKIAQGAP
jgi:prepilin-type N-terminal cleavage/methylation domain-containing protein